MFSITIIIIIIISEAALKLKRLFPSLLCWAAWATGKYMAWKKTGNRYAQKDWSNCRRV